MSACAVQAVPFPAPPSAAQDRRGALAECLASVPKLSAVTAASRLEVRGAPERAPSGTAELDRLTGGLPRGCLSQICGGASSGRTSLSLAALAAATRRQEVCALVDASDAFDPQSGAAAGIDFDKLLWIRCSEQASRAQARTSREHRPLENRIEQALRAVDLLLQSGGFGLVVMDFSDIPYTSLRRIPLASWFRFQRVVEPTSTVILILAQNPCAASCTSLLLELERGAFAVPKPPARVGPADVPRPAHAELFSGLQVCGELQPCRGQRKPPQPVRTQFTAASLRTG